MSVCIQEDDFIRYKLRWFANLSNGEIVYQDDHREGEAEPIAWLRLKSYVVDQHLDIISVGIQFCDNVLIVTPSYQEGYYYSQGIIGIYGSLDCIMFYTVGHVKGGIAYVTKWEVPAIIPLPFPEELREIVGNEESVIMNGDFNGERTN